ncbi:sulfotransferase family protein [Nitzschia inconspicua]|uniref:Sulfotransferase family protein n=1 Tax=Nitzschia inconspicua TaxID=303405 RepID=A0A9K3LAB9_9STRA|nr:sulfotransferase family protein [Nitzschia inconspicua]
MLPDRHKISNNGGDKRYSPNQRHNSYNQKSQQRRKRLIQVATVVSFVVVSVVTVFSFQQMSTQRSLARDPATRDHNDRTADRKWLQMQLKRPKQNIAEDALTHHHKKTLPDFSNGGIVAFYHMYKTGGSTTGMMMNRLAGKYDDRMNFTMMREFVRWEEECLPVLDLAEREKKIVLVELHVEHPSPHFPSIVDLAPTMKRWRMEAHRRNLGFFSFTLVREPVSHTISFFNFFQVRLESYDRDWNPWRAQAPTETNLMQQFVPDRQCRMLGSDPEGTMSAPASGMWEPPPTPKNPDLRNCRMQELYDAIWDTMDWVGLTETLSNETLPLLSKLLINNATYGKDTKPVKVFNRGKSKIRGVLKEDLSPASLDRIKRESVNDKKLWDDVRRNFTFANLGWDIWFHS